MSATDSPSSHLRPVRVGVVQLQMRPLADLAAFFDQVSFFIEATAGYEADFVCFPEYVNAPLMAPFKSEGAAAAIRSLAGRTGEIR
ncbi:MAG TPA: carbon-nitrogen hydrolase, partial [Bacteroidia bacterium]|nr:carbon-nitrogen hydrolase [Bacteroidia bacterium]